MNRIDRMLALLVNNEKTGCAGFAEYSPSTMRKLVRRLGNPHRAFKSIHIAGTNGKGSTAFMINEIFMRSGYKTGLYISPHLEKVNERISVNRHPVATKRLLLYLERILEESRAGRLRPTYFDALTAAAFCYFRDESVDLAVIETGLGGRLDSTNVIRPLVSVITNISLDHTALLGGDIPAIAREKAGIIKYRVPVLTSNASAIALDAIRSASKVKKAVLYVHGQDYKAGIKHPQAGGATSFAYRFGTRLIDTLPLKPSGKFQVINAGLAVTASLLLERAGFAIGDDAIKNALEKLVIPGRLEIISKIPLILFDPAHNPQAMRLLMDEIKVLYPHRRPVFILSFMKDKAVNSMLAIVKTVCPVQIFYYELDDDRCYIPSLSSDKDGPVKLRIIRGENKVTRLADEIRQYMNEKFILIATGSFRLYPDIKRLAISIT